MFGEKVLKKGFLGLQGNRRITMVGKSFVTLLFYLRWALSEELESRVHQGIIGGLGVVSGCSQV